MVPASVALDPGATEFPGGSSLSNPVPYDVAYFANDWTYGAIVLAAFLLILFFITRLNADR